MSESITGPGVDAEKTERIIAQLDNLPAIAPVATRILALTESDHSNAKDLAELVASDPALTTRVLSLAGRAEHGLTKDALTVGRAVVLLGFKAVRQVTLAVKVMDVFGASREDEAEAAAFDRGEFWRHCLAVACAARRIAMHVKRGIDPEEAFILGLLHDMGKIALDAALPKSFDRIVRKADETRADIADIERRMLGVDHTVVGRRLAERWNLPRILVETIWLHHQPVEGLPSSIAAGKHVQIVQLADTLAREQHIGYSGNHVFNMTSRQLAESVGVDESARVEVIETLADEIAAKAAWIGVEDITSREVYVNALLRTADELSAANADLAEKNKRLSRKAQYFQALEYLNANLSVKASLREACGAAAESLRRALSLPAAVVFAASPIGRWIEAGYANGEIRPDIIERSIDAMPGAADAHAAVQLADAGTWIAPPDRAFDFIVDRYRGELGEGPCWFLPIIREQGWVAGAIFCYAAEHVAALRTEVSEIASMSAAVGLAISQAQAHAEAFALNDELAEGNRRLAAAQGELARAQAAEAVAVMAAGAAHEMNNPLAVISGRAQQLRAQAKEESSREMLQSIIERAQACSDIATELLEFAQPRSPEPRDVDLPTLLAGLFAELSDEGLLAAEQVVFDIPSDTPNVWFDEAQLARVFRELLLNAIDATQISSRLLTVKAKAVMAEEFVVMEVVDNGRGMTPEVQRSALNPFFSHQPAGRKRGLGLARVHRWLKLNGGSIEIDSTPGEGTTIRLRLPTRAGRTA